MKTSVKNTKEIWKELLWFIPSRVSNDWVEISGGDKSNAWVDELIRQKKERVVTKDRFLLFLLLLVRPNADSHAHLLLWFSH